MGFESLDLLFAGCCYMDVWSRKRLCRTLKGFGALYKVLECHLELLRCSGGGGGGERLMEGP